MIYAISNHKRGVGKTVSCINIGAFLANKNKKILLIDLDPEAKLTRNLKIKNNTNNIYENLMGKKIAQPIEYKNNLYILPSSFDLSSIEMDLNSELGKEYILKNVLSCFNNKFEYILIDCPSSLGFLTISALSCANYTLIPTQIELLCLSDLMKLDEMIKKIQVRLNNMLQIGCIFFTHYNYKKKINLDITKNMLNYFGNKLSSSKIYNNIALYESSNQGKDIFIYNRNCQAAIDYDTLCKEMIEKKIF